MEAFLRELMPRILPRDCTFEAHPFQGKSDMLSRLGDRLRAYAAWLPNDWRILVLVDQDDDDCARLKRLLEECATAAGLRTRSSGGAAPWQIVSRIAIEELEAWYFGDWQAVKTLFPKVPSTIPSRAGYRDPDSIRGGTWETFERILQQHGYFQGGLRKVEAARLLGGAIEPTRNLSRSFTKLHEAINEALA
jgi:hypothetical protein